MPIHIVQLEERPRRKREGLRIGAVRRVPRKPKGSMYDVWLPELAPSQELFKQRHDLQLPNSSGVTARRCGPSLISKHLIAMLARSHTRRR